MSVKEYLDGFMHIQISTNSTNEDERKYLFGGADVVTIEEMKKEFNNMPNGKLPDPSKNKNKTNFNKLMNIQCEKKFINIKFNLIKNQTDFFIFKMSLF